MSWSTELQRAPQAEWVTVTVRPVEGAAVTRIGYRIADRWHVLGAAPSAVVIAWDHLPPPLRMTR